ncbi:tumor necrosis factor receptor superfamily member 14-like isoform X2 [Toxotes jaculatrix]|uniref:tumor necrosis factor receptor superfamily member 14-like isoform X2 n=1 Tax=Toxotes jaculatrix TaxID=941984 RepID=UPI001B3AB667|nr:tumor necrosis factor receptor superfamily member 14-like isoform X2 [Toxotes jaculatrix]
MLTLCFPVGCVFAVPALCCRAKEYITGDGQCCPMCLEGTVVRRDCTEQSGTQCIPCADGTFMNHPNGLNKCFPCTSCVPALGLFSKQKCTATSDTVCDVLSGYFCKSLADDTGCIMAEKHTKCAPGQRTEQPGTSRADTVCEDCQPGYFSQDGVNCTAWTIGGSPVCSLDQARWDMGGEGGPSLCDHDCGALEQGTDPPQVPGRRSRQPSSPASLLVYVLCVCVLLNWCG